jgi:cardiolipin synthase (CMP-forming)
MFVEEHLEELRRERFAPTAVVCYLQRVARHAREHMVAHPGAIRSVWSLALGFFGAAFLAAAAMALTDDRWLAYEFFLHTSLWILVAFGLVTLYIGLLRDRDGYSLSAINVPIALSLLRVTLVPGIVLLLLDHRFALATGAFVFAAMTDVADGWFARRFGQITKLGTLLDPIVDVVFNLGVIGGLWFSGLVGPVVLAFAVLRYAILLVGGACLYLFVGPVRIQPTWFGRLTGVVTSALIGFLILLHAFPAPWSAALIPLTRIALGLLLAATVAHVVALGWYNLKIMTGQATRRVMDDVRWGS